MEYKLFSGLYDTHTVRSINHVYHGVGSVEKVLLKVKVVIWPAPTNVVCLEDGGSHLQLLNDYLMRRDEFLHVFWSWGQVLLQ